MNGCGAALYNANDPAGSAAKTLPMLRGQAEALVPLAKEVMEQGGKAFSNLDLIVTTIGPGTFTGLRVGMSAARSFALALDVPIIGLTTLDVLAQMYQTVNEPNTDHILCVLIETKRSDYYIQMYDVFGAPLNEPSALEGEEIARIINDAAKPVIVIGDAALRFKEECGHQFVKDVEYRAEAFMQPDPMILAIMGATKFASGKNPDINPQPLYLRGADASSPKSAARYISQ